MRLSTDKKRFTYCAITHEYDTINHQLQNYTSYVYQDFMKKHVLSKANIKAVLEKWFKNLRHTILLIIW